MFVPDQPYESEGLAPQQIRDDFQDVICTHDPWPMLYRLASYLPASTLAEFMDDLAMGRI